MSMLRFHRGPGSHITTGRPIKLSQPGVRVTNLPGHRAIVERYIATKHFVAEAASQALSDSKRRIEASLLSRLMSETHIIEVPPKLYHDFILHANAFVAGRILEMGHKCTPDEVALMSKRVVTTTAYGFKQEQPKAYLDAANEVLSMLQNWGWPPRYMPFPMIYLGYDTPFEIPPFPGEEEAGYGPFFETSYHIEDREAGTPQLYAQVVTEKICVSFFVYTRSFEDETGAGYFMILPVVEYDDSTDLNRWSHPAGLAMFAFEGIMRFIENHQMVLECKTKKFSHRRVMQQIGKATKQKLIPPAYYTVTIRDHAITEHTFPKRTPDTGRRGEFTYSHSRRATIAWKVKRGPLPLSNKDRIELLRPRQSGWGYKIFEHEAPTGEWAEAVRKRGNAPKRSDEWIAILKIERPYCIVRPDLPYVPSTRRSEKHKRKEK